MVPMNFAKLTLFFVVLTSFATSQPFSRSHGATKRSGFEWNARKIGTKKVATISIRKDEERDRRSVPLADVVSSIRKTHPGLSPEPLLTGERRHHHHRHHHGDDAEDVEYLPDGRGGGGGGGRGRGASEDDSSIDEMLDLKDAQLSEMRIAAESVDTSRLHDILVSSGLDVDAEVFKNVTATTADRRRRRKNGNKKSGKKRSKKVKRDRRKKKNRNKNRRSKERRKHMKKCRHLKGRQKKKCRAAARAAAETDIFSFIKKSISMSGSEACQYHNLEECCRKVGFLSLAPERLLPPVVKCRYREEFFDCMEEQRREDCPSNFKIKGDMKALRTKIRDVIWTTNSCLISEVIEG